MAFPEEIIVGDTLNIDFTFIDKVTKLPVDITGWVLYLTLKPDPAMTDQNPKTIQAKYDLAIADPLALMYSNLIPASGKVRLRISPERTKLLTLGKVYWDLQRVIPIRDSGGFLKDHDVITLEKRTSVVVYEVTKTYLQGVLVP